MGQGPLPAPFPSPYNPPGTPADVRKLIHFRTNGVQPPSNLYVDVNDSLIITVSSIDTTGNFTVTYRILEPDGQIIVGRHDQALAATPRAGQNFTYQLTEGFLLTVEVALSGGTQKRAGTRIRCSILRGTLSGGLNCFILSQGYLDNYTGLSWPPGYMEPLDNGQGNLLSITGTTPAAGAEINEVVPNGARWKLKTFRFQLTTSATVATRGVTFTIDDGANILWQIEAPSTQAASLVQQYNFANIGARADKVFGTNIAIPLPADMALAETWRIRTVTSNLQVGDQYTAPQYNPEEWITPH